MPTEAEQLEDQESQAENDLWFRLRQSIDRLANRGKQEAAPAALTEKLAQRAKQLRSRMTSEEAPGE